ncbi:MAG: nucleoside triphosphate pyrophosphatase [Bacteroidota bacterium]
MRLVKPLILASRSPRRLHLLRQIGLEPQVIPCDVPEDFLADRSPAENARELAVTKANAVAVFIDRGCVLGADTIVSIDGQLLGKPTDAHDARRMLKLLSGKIHRVHTGYALIDRPSGRIMSGVEETFVQFRELPDEEIAEYVEGGSPMDKAGAYGIQDDYGAVFVKRVEGCYYNVVGLPLSAVYSALVELGTIIPQVRE